MDGLMPSEKTAYDRIIKSLKSHRVIAILLVVSVTVIGAAQLTGALRDLWLFLRGLTPLDTAIAIEGDLIPEEGVKISGHLAVTLYWDNYDSVDERFQAPAVVLVDPTSSGLSFKLVLSSYPPQVALLTIPPRGRFIKKDGRWIHTASDEMRMRGSEDSIVEFPPPNAGQDYPESSFGIGIIIAFDDTNGNGIKDSNETLVGVCSDVAITYIKGDMRKSTTMFISSLGFERTADMDNSPFLSLPQGYSFVRVVPPENDDGDCDVLIPAPLQRIYIMLYSDHKKIRWPNWT